MGYTRPQEVRPQVLAEAWALGLVLMLVVVVVVFDSVRLMVPYSNNMPW